MTDSASKSLRNDSTGWHTAAGRSPANRSAFGYERVVDHAQSPATIASFDAGLGEHLAALGARDIERFARTLVRSSQLRVVGPHGEITVGYDAVYAAHADWFAAGNAWSFESHEVWRHGGYDLGIALLNVIYRDAPAADPVRFLLSLAFVREDDGNWRLIYDQNTPLVGSSI